jgi:hypothetical protein
MEVRQKPLGRPLQQSALIDSGIIVTRDEKDARIPRPQFLPQPAEVREQIGADEIRGRVSAPEMWQNVPADEDGFRSGRSYGREELPIPVLAAVEVGNEETISH